MKLHVLQTAQGFCWMSFEFDLDASRDKTCVPFSFVKDVYMKEIPLQTYSISCYIKGPLSTEV